MTMTTKEILRTCEWNKKVNILSSDKDDISQPDSSLQSMVEICVN